MKKSAVLILCVMVFALICCASYAADKSKIADKAPAGQSQIMPKKASVDTNYDGKPDRFEYYDDTGKVTKVEVDANSDGISEEMVIYENGRPVRSARDTNGDGKPDVWMDF